MTMIGLKKVLFPLYDDHIYQSSRLEKRRGLASRELQGDTLAKLGQFTHPTRMKRRRTKRERDRSIPANKPRGFAKDITNQDCTATKQRSYITKVPMDSLASLGSSAIPKTVSPQPVEKSNDTNENMVVDESKSEDEANTACARAKGKKRKVKCSRKKWTSRNASDTAEERKQGSSTKEGRERHKRRQHCNPTQSSTIRVPTAGLGTMFGIPIQHTGNVNRSKKAERQLDVKSPIQSPVKGSVPQSDDSQAAGENGNCAQIQGNETGVLINSIQARSDRKVGTSDTKVSDASGSNSISKSGGAKGQNQAYATKRRSKRQRVLHDKAASDTLDCRMNKGTPPMKDAGRKLRDIGKVGEEEMAPVAQARDTTPRWSKRKRSMDSSSQDTSISQGQWTKAVENESNSVHEHASSDSTAKKVRRSKRIVVPPDRLRAGSGTLSTGSCSTGKSKAARPFKKRDNKKQKSENSGDVDKSAKDPSDNLEGWSKTELDLLRKAHQMVDPKSSFFWEEISVQVRSKTSLQCRERWFSFVETPAHPGKKSKKANVENSVPCNQDDIFDATPMRSVFHLSGPFAVPYDFGNLGHQFDVGSAIKVASDSESLDTESAIHRTKHGYKTYIKNVKRDMNASSKSRFPRGPAMKARRNKKLISFKDGEGDFEVAGRLSPGGTLRMETESDHSGEEQKLDFFLSEDEE